MRDLLEGLTGAQRLAVMTDAAPLCILAGPGSGKTRVLTRRIARRLADGSAEAAHVLALTFTRRAAVELSDRLTQLGVRERVVTGTFHAFAWAQLHRRWADAGRRQPAILDRPARLLQGGAGAEPQAVAAEIGWAKARMVRPDDYEREVAAAGRPTPAPAGLVADLYRGYEHEKRRRGLIDFDDVLASCVLALENDPDFAAAQRWRSRHLFVDEYQDVNAVQHRLLAGWLGGRQDLCVVGDPNQAVYGWNGADASFLTGFRHFHPTAEVVTLDRNHRCTPAIEAVASAALSGSAPAPTGVGPDVSVGTGVEGAVPTVVAHPDERTEARAVARRLRTLRATRPWSHLAVLARTNAQVAVLSGALGDAGVPTRRRTVKPLAHPEVREAFAELARSPAQLPLAARLPDVKAIVDASVGTDAEAVLADLLRLAHDFAALDPSGSPRAFRAWLGVTVEDAEPPQDAVDVLTFHRAKGLEWPVVFVTGLEQGLVPVGHAPDPSKLDEERRLLYVALTRASSELHLSWAERRTFADQVVDRAPSPFLAAIEQTCGALEREAERPVDWRRHLRDSRRQLGPGGAGGGNDVPGATAEALESLRAWRLQLARAACVAPTAILADHVLSSLADRRPRDLDQLLAVPGLDPFRVAQYGDRLLAILAGHASAA